MIEKESTVKGILEIISSHGVRNLVMGAASDKNYSRNMTEIKSRKAISVRLQAPVSCQICFVCKGRLIHIREGISDVGNYVRSFKQPPSTQHEPPSTLFRSRSAVHRPAQDSLSEVYGYGGGGRLSVSTTTITDENERVPSTPRDTSNEFTDFESRSPRSCILSHCSSSGARSGNVPRFLTQGSQVGMGLMGSALSDSISKHHGDDPIGDGLMMKGDEIQSRRESLEEAVRRAKADKEAFEEFISLKRDALEEAFRRANAEKVAADAIETAKALETLLSDELKRRKETEEMLAKERDELQNTLKQKHLQEKQMEESSSIMKELEQKIISAVELLQHYKKERDQLLTERESALKEAEELKRTSSTNSSNPLFPEFTKSEIEEATSNFNASLKIGEGGFGSIYKAEIRYTQVAVKLLDPNGLQGPSEFHKEVDILSKMRHPNLVTLIGACSESCALIYEYLPNGSLEDRLNCKNNSQPLPWRVRLRIAAEVCSVLIFLHSCKPNSIVHGDVKPSNVLLDANFVSKLSDFGIARWLHNHEGGAGGGSANRTVFWRTDPKGTLAYIDPEFFSTGKLTSKSDVYSFGVILLRLLTGRPAVGLQTEVHCALSEGNLEGVLDPLGGDWPMKPAEELARMALRCCEMNRQNRPDLTAEVWGKLKVFFISSGE
ncbi:U-box domain-containing protein 33 [Linum perenne]